MVFFLLPLLFLILCSLFLARSSLQMSVQRPKVATGTCATSAALSVKRHLADNGTSCARVAPTAAAAMRASMQSTAMPVGNTLVWRAGWLNEEIGGVKINFVPASSRPWVGKDLFQGPKVFSLDFTLRYPVLKQWLGSVLGCLLESTLSLSQGRILGLLLPLILDVVVVAQKLVKGTRLCVQ